MPLNLDVNKANPSTFQLVLPVLPYESGLDASKELTLNLFNTIIPSISLTRDNSYWMGAQTPEQGELTYESWNINFIVDQNFHNWKILFNWITNIKDNKTIFATRFKDYVIDASLVALDNYRNKVLEITFNDLFITSLGEVNFSYRDGGNTILEGSATFEYMYITIPDL